MEYTYATIIILFLIGAILVSSVNAYNIKSQIDWDGKGRELNIPEWSSSMAHLSNCLLCVIIFICMLTFKNCESDKNLDAEIKSKTLEQYEIEIKKKARQDLMQDINTLTSPQNDKLNSI